MTNSRPLQSPSSYNSTHGASGLYATPAADARRGRASTGGNFGGAPRVWPTPEPTIGSALSEEDKDVVMQLMRLGDVSNFSYGRTPASTHDETLSGRAEMASSTGATSSDCESESEDEEPPAKQQKTAHHASYEAAEGRFAPPANGNGTAGSANYNTAPAAGGRPKLKANTLVGPGSRDYAVPGVPKAAKSANKPKVSRAGANGKSKKANGPGVLGPMSPPSLPASRKPSVGASNGGAALALGDEETADLSTKPRCQRCRKSKKGCDRQRPCGRCKDAGIPADQCISEDEGNGRKGRYGRHMGVPIPKAMTASQASTTATTAAKTAADAPAEAHASANAHDHHGHAAGSAPSAPISTSFIPPPVPRTLLPPAPIAQASMAAPSAIAMDKSKKRKR